MVSGAQDPDRPSNVTNVLFQRFPLGGDDEVMNSTLQQFAKVIDEVSHPPPGFVPFELSFL